MSDLSYRVTAGDQTPRYGHHSAWAFSPEALADAVAQDMRVTRPDITDPLTIHVWPTREEEHYRLPVPDDAGRFEYPAASTALEG